MAFYCCYFRIFDFDGERNGEDTVPIKTVYDEESRTISADIPAEGIYFVLDVISWLDSLGFEYAMETGGNASATIQSFSLRTEDVLSLSNMQINGQVDIVFLIDTTGSMGTYIRNVKNNINDFVNEIEAASITPNFALVEYRDITFDGQDSTNVKENIDYSNWFKGAEEFKTELSKLTIDGGGDTPETAIDALEMARQLDLRKSSQKFFILVTDAGYKISNNYGIQSMDEMIELLNVDNINVSIVSNPTYQAVYELLYKNTGGIFANVSGNFKDELLAIADMIGEETNSGCWVALKGLIPQIVRLDERPTTGGTADTDRDTFIDVEELKSVEPTKHIDIKPYLYLLGLPTDYCYTTLPVYDYYTNPVKADTDGDGILDKDDPLKFEYGISRKMKYTYKDKLCAEIDYQIKKDFNLFMENKNVGYYSTEECIDIIYRYDSLITRLSNEYRLPKAAIQTILLRELRCYDARDTVAESLVTQQFTYLHLVEEYNNLETWQQLMIGYPTAPIPYVEDASVGYGQIFIETAMEANEWALKKGLVNSDDYDYANWKHREKMWVNLKDDNEYNIRMIALVLMWSADEQGLNNQYWLYNEEEIKKMLERYNGFGDDALKYANDTYNCYVIFEKYNQMNK